MYEEAENYSSSEERRDESLKKAIHFMEKQKAENETSDMSPEDIVEAAKKFEKFIEEK